MPFTKYWLWDVWYTFIRRAWQLSLECEHSLWEQCVKERGTGTGKRQRQREETEFLKRERGVKLCLPTTTTSSSLGSVDKHDELSCFSFTLYVGWMAGLATHWTYGGFPPFKELYKYLHNPHTQCESYYSLHGVSSIGKICPFFSFTMWLYHWGLLFFVFDDTRDQRWTYALHTIIDTQRDREVKRTRQANVKEIMRIDLLMRNLSMNSRQPGSTEIVINRLM